MPALHRAPYHPEYKPLMRIYTRARSSALALQASRTVSEATLAVRPRPSETVFCVYRVESPVLASVFPPGFPKAHS